MNLREYYVFNPGYYLRNDLNRVVIGSYDDMPEDIDYDSTRTTLIHPVNAQMLAFFDGTKALGEVIKEIALYFNLPYETVAGIVEQFIENKEVLHIKYGQHNITFPRNIIIRSRGYNRREYYKPEEFTIEGEIDLTPGRLNKPINLVFELTMLCYTDCTYCYADRRNIALADMLTLDQICSIIRDAKRTGIVDFGINGGEVMMHPHWREVFYELTANGYYPLISTKRPIPVKDLEYLKEIGMNRIQISLDSVNSFTLTKLLGVRGDYLDRLRSTMRQLDEMEFKWQVNTILTKYNDDIDNELKPLLNEITQYKHLQQIRVNAAGYSLYKTPKHYNQIKIGKDKIGPINKCIEEYEKKFPAILFEGEHNASLLENLTIEEREKTFKQRFICSGNIYGFVILPDGKVTICEELYWHPRFIIGDLKKQSIMDMWSSKEAMSLYHISQMAIPRDSPCRECKTFSDCRSYKGVCWKEIIEAYGHEKWYYPDPDCPQAPPFKRRFYLE